MKVARATPPTRAESCLARADVVIYDGLVNPELLALAPTPLSVLVLAKCLAHWLTTGLPVILAAPVIALLYGLEADAFAPLLGAMLLGTPSLSLIGAIGAALLATGAAPR